MVTAQDLVLYQYPQCPFCAMVLSCIDELGVQIELKNTRTDSEARKELLDATGKTQVPCLFIQGKPMFESADIIDYLEENFRS